MAKVTHAANVTLRLGAGGLDLSHWCVEDLPQSLNVFKACICLTDGNPEKGGAIR
jgi:hypothetical protein